MQIRQASKSDQDAIQDLIMTAFPDEENALIATLVSSLIITNSEPATISFVALIDGDIVGYIGYSPVYFDQAPDITAYILAPLGVLPATQKQGVGSTLIKAGISELTNQGVQLLFVYGDPAYYGRFGFKEETAKAFVAPYSLEFPFGWQALQLNSLPQAIESMTMRCVPALNKAELW